MQNNQFIEKFDALVGRLTPLFTQMQRDHGLPRTEPELSAISLAFFIIKTAILAKPVSVSWTDPRDSADDRLTQLQTSGSNSVRQLKELAEHRISDTTPEAQRAHVIKFMDRLLQAYPTLRGIRTNDCIQLIEGFDYLRLSVSKPKEILFGTFECWCPLLNAIDVEMVGVQRDCGGL